MFSARVVRSFVPDARNYRPALSVWRGLTVVKPSVRYMSSSNGEIPTGIPKSQIPPGQEDLYVLKSDIAKVDNFTNGTFGTEAANSFPADGVAAVEQDASVSAAATEAVAANVSSLGMKPQGLFMQGLEYLHVSLGLPYWECIVVAALLIRVSLLPFALNSVRTGQRMVKLQPELTALNAKYMGATGTIPKDRAQEYAREYHALTAKYDVHPLRAFLLPMFQIPISICAFMGIREMDKYFPDFATGGYGWFEQLSEADPTYILPVLNSVTFLAIVEMGRFNQVAATTQEQHQKQSLIRNVMRVLGVGMIPVTASMPAGLLCFWVTSNTWNMLQTGITSIKGVKERFLQ